MKLLGKFIGSKPASQKPPAVAPQDVAARKAVPVKRDIFPYRVGALTDRGAERARNEDALFCMQTVLSAESESLPFGIFAIADGLGGHEDGQIASELTIRAVSSYLLQTVYVPLAAGEGQNAAGVPLNESFTNAIELANRAVRQNTHGGGSTLTAAILFDRTAYIVHLGDSRAYLINEGTITQLTHDHSLGGRLMEIQDLSAEEVSQLPGRHTLYKALGQPALPEPDIHYHSLAPTAHLLLCSDGLWGFVSQQDILEAFAACGDPQSICTRLLDLALTNGSDDNISMIVLLSAHGHAKPGASRVGWYESDL